MSLIFLLQLFDYALSMLESSHRYTVVGGDETMLNSMTEHSICAFKLFESTSLPQNMYIVCLSLGVNGHKCLCVSGLFEQEYEAFFFQYFSKSVYTEQESR